MRCDRLQLVAQPVYSTLKQDNIVYRFLSMIEGCCCNKMGAKNDGILQIGVRKVHS